MKQKNIVIGIIVGMSLFFGLSQSVYALDNKSVNITVRDNNGALVDAMVYGYSAVDIATNTSGNSGDDGTIALDAGQGEWMFKVDVSTSETDPDEYPWMYTGVGQIIDFTEDSTVEAYDLEFIVTSASALLSATFVDVNGDPLVDGSAADITFTRSDGIKTIRKVNGSGVVQVYLLPGIYHVWADSAQIEDTHSLPETIFIITAGETKDLGTIAAIEKGSQITGNLVDGDGAALTGKQLVFRRKNSPERLYQTAVDDGYIGVHVAPGEYTATFSDIGDNVNYVLLKSINVTVDSNSETIDLGNIVAYEKDMSIDGEVRVDEIAVEDFEGTIVAKSTDGSASFYTKVEPDGGFSLKLPSVMVNTTDLNLDVITMPESGYYLTEPYTITVQTGTVIQNIVLSSESSTIAGNITDQSGNILTDLGTDVEVVAISHNGSTEKVEVADDGSYSMSVPAGSWVLGIRLDNEEDATFIKSAANYSQTTVELGQQSNINIPVIQAGATISGTVLDNDGEAVSLAPVIISNMREENIEQDNIVYISTYTDANGDYSVAVPEGEYDISVGTNPNVNDLVEPIIHEVEIDAGEAQDVDMQYRAADAIVTGSVTADSTIEVAKVIAYSNDGGYVESNVADDGTFSLSVIEGNWHFLASGLVDDQLYISEETTLKISDSSVSQDLVIATTGQEVPATTSVVEDADELLVIGNEAGVTAIMEPFGAAVSQTVYADLIAVPEIIVTAEGVQAGIGYELEITNQDNEITQLNRPATIILPTEEKDYITGEDLNEDGLAAQYWSPQEQVWQPDGVSSIVDTENNQVVLQTDHLTRFSVNCAKSTSALSSVPEKITGLKLPSNKRKMRQAQLKWTADDNAVSYRVQLRTKKGTKIKTYTTTKTYKLFKKKVLLSNKAYKARVRGVNADGEKGEWSDYKSFRTKPAKVKKLTISDITASSAMINFDKPRGTVKRYLVRVYKNKTFVKKYRLIKKMKKNKKHKYIDGFESGVIYTVKVRTVYNTKNHSVWKQKKFTTF